MKALSPFFPLNKVHLKEWLAHVEEHGIPRFIVSVVKEKIERGHGRNLDG